VAVRDETVKHEASRCAGDVCLVRVTAGLAVGDGIVSRGGNCSTRHTEAAVFPVDGRATRGETSHDDRATRAVTSHTGLAQRV
jgi:hypothetical protein